MKIPPASNGSLEDFDLDGTDSQDDDVSTAPTDFSEYMWMENEEEFDKQVMQQLEEEALMEQCIEAMIEDELENKPEDNANFVCDFQKMCVQEKEKAELAKKSTLNPDAAEFVPRASSIGEINELDVDSN